MAEKVTLGGVVIGGTEYDIGGSGGGGVMSTDDESSANLNIGDEAGNVIAEFRNGHIKTKNFDSSKVSESGNWLKGKTVAIFGDSISTNGDPGSGQYANVPELKIELADIGQTLSAYPTAKDIEANLSIGGHTFTDAEVGTEVTFVPTDADVGKIIGRPLTYNPNSRKVWWEWAAEKLKFTPIAVCWSGSSITSHEDRNAYRCAHAWHPSQIRKAGIRTPGTMNRTAPDVILVYRGTNDFSHSPNTKLTEDFFKTGKNFVYPETDVLSDGGYGYKEGITLLVAKLREAYPLARIFLCTMNVFKRGTFDHYPTRNSYNSLPEFNNAIREAANFLGCGLIDFDKDGITFENGGVGDYFADWNESNKSFTHPNDKGHKVMGMKAIADLLAQGYTDE